jgi:hypothetical protein
LNIPYNSSPHHSSRVLLSVDDDTGRPSLSAPGAARYAELEAAAARYQARVYDLERTLNLTLALVTQQAFGDASASLDDTHGSSLHKANPAKSAGAVASKSVGRSALALDIWHERYERYEPSGESLPPAAVAAAVRYLLSHPDQALAAAAPQVGDPDTAAMLHSAASTASSALAVRDPWLVRANSNSASDASVSASASPTAAGWSELGVRLLAAQLSQVRGGVS